MEKILFSCFLALLCLFGSTLKAQVACSPPGFELVDCPGSPALAGFHRSGETRSDTFYSVTPQDIDGGPHLRPAHLGGSSSNKSDKRGDNIHESAVDCRLSTDDYNKKGFSLVDTSSSPRQESENSSAIFESKQESQAVLYIELEGETKDSLYQIHLWDKIGATGFSMETARTILTEIAPNDFFRGMLPTVSGALDIRTGELESPTYLSVSENGRKVLSPYLVFPGDSALIRVNPSKGTLHFSGQTGEQLLLQQQLQGLLDNEEFTKEQLVVVPDKESYLSGNGNREKLEQGKLQFGRTMLVLQQGDEELEWLEAKLADSAFDLAVQRMSAAYLGRIPGDRLTSFQADAMGRYYAIRSRQLGRIIPKISDGSRDQAERLLSQLQEKFDAIEQGQWHIAGIVEFWKELNDAKMQLQSESPLDWIGKQKAGYPRDLLVEYYFFSKGKSINDLDAQLEKGLALVADPDVSTRLSQIKAVRSLGSPVLPMPLLSLDGDTLTLNRWKGQVTLVEFWLSGCGACLTRYQKVMKPLEEHFSGDPRFRIVSVSVDKSGERWKGNIGIFSSITMTNARTLPESFGVLRGYGIGSYPGFMLLGRDAQILKVSGFPNDLEKMIQLISHALDEGFPSASGHPDIDPVKISEKTLKKDPESNCP